MRAFVIDGCRQLDRLWIGRSKASTSAQAWRRVRTAVERADLRSRGFDSLSRAVSSIKHQNLPTNEVRCGGRQEQNRVGDLYRLAESTERDLRQHWGPLFWRAPDSLPHGGGQNG